MKMKKHIVLVFFMFFVVGLLFCDTFVSTSEGGDWVDSDTWVNDQPGDYPGPVDDVIINGLVLVGSVSCLNIDIQGGGSILNYPSTNCVLTTYGYFKNIGSIFHNSSGSLTLNLYGDLEIHGIFLPNYLKFLGSGDRQIMNFGNPIKATNSIQIASTVGTIYAASDLVFANGNANTALEIIGLDTQATICLANPIARTVYDLQTIGCRLNNIIIQGGSTGVFTNQNPSSLGSVHHLNCLLEDVTLAGTHWFSDNCSISNIVNNAIIYNTISLNKTLSLYGNTINHGEIRSSPQGGVLTVNIYGNITNLGLFNPYIINLKGAADRIFTSFHAFPIQAVNSLNADADIGNIIPGDSLHFANISYMGSSSGQIIPFKLFDSSRTARSVNIRNCTLNKAVLEGISGSRLYGSGLTLVNTSITNVILEGDNSVQENCILSNCSNSGILQNSQYGNYTLALDANFINNGTIRNNPSSSLLLISSTGDLINNGIWQNYETKLSGSAHQQISFPQEHPYTGSRFIDNDASSQIIPLSDLYFFNTNIYTRTNNTNNLWNFTAGNYSLNLDNCQVTGLDLQTNLNNLLYMTNGSYLSTCSLTSITTSGILQLNTDVSVTGSLVNNGIIQNFNNNITLQVSSDIINNGSIRNHPSASYLYVSAGGNVTNNGIWSSYKLTLSGAVAQTIYFPQSYPLQNTRLYDTNPESPIIAGCSLYFVNCAEIYTRYNNTNTTWQFSSPDHGLNFENSPLIGAAVQSNIGNIFNMTGTSYLDTCTFGPLTSTGVITIRTSISINGNWLNNGTLQSSYNNVYLYVYGDVINNGIIRSGTSTYLYTHVTGNISNGGVWSNYLLKLTGTADQTISFPSAYPFTGYSFLDDNPSSAIVANGDLYFTGTQINTRSSSSVNNSWQLMAGGYDLHLSGCHLYGADLVSGVNCIVNFQNSSSISTSSMQSITIAGIMTLSSNITVNGDLVNTGTIKTGNDYYRFYVYGNVTNQVDCLIGNSSGSYKPYLYVYQNLTNYGSLHLLHLYFSGTADQDFLCTGTITTSNITDTDSGSAIRLLADLELNNISFALNGANLNLNTGTRNPVTLSLLGGTLYSGSVTGGNGACIYMDSGAYINSITASEIILDGNALVYSNVVIGHLINNGSLSNHPNDYYYLDISSRLENYGTISNNGSRSLFLRLQGDLYNHGTMTNGIIRFNGSGDQYIYQSPSASVITGNTMEKSTGTGNLIMLSDLRLNVLTLSTNNADGSIRKLVMDHAGNRYDLYMNGGTIINTYLYSDLFSHLELINNASLNSVNGKNLCFYGSVPVNNTCSFENLDNYASLRSGNDYYTLKCLGNLNNFGSISNPSYYLYLEVGGNLVNSGTISNYRIRMNGVNNQILSLNGTETMNVIELTSNIGSSVWYYNGSPTAGSGSTKTLYMNSPDLYGNWQPYNSLIPVWGRTISIVLGAVPVPPQNLSIQCSGASITLEWDEVSTATWYNIYASDNPSDGFVLVYEHISDPEIGDGRVSYSFPLDSNFKFFMVSSGN